MEIHQICVLSFGIFFFVNVNVSVLQLSKGHVAVKALKVSPCTHALKTVVGCG